MKPIRVAIICDYPEEGWPSMDLTAEMTLQHLAKGHNREIEVNRVCPPFRQLASRLPLGRASTARNVDRLLNRYHCYPKFLRHLVKQGSFDLYHVIDHSYAQLVHEIPSGRSVVTCHDLDTFRCLLQPDLESRPAWFRTLTHRTLRGLQKATAISCDSEATRSAILEHRLVTADRLTTNYLGANTEFVADSLPEVDTQVDRLIGPAGTQGEVDLLHVGSNIARKRIDVLLATFAGVRQKFPRARLIKVGGEFTPAQAAQARDLGVIESIQVIPFLTDRLALAGLYRRATIVLQPSEAEGFGLPLVEAMACGSALLISDIPVFREVAGDSAIYCSVGNIKGWTQAALSLIDEVTQAKESWQARQASGFTRSAVYRWDAHASRLVGIYQNLFNRLHGEDPVQFLHKPS